ncbi:ATP-binding protein [Desulfatiglans anilini]|uniref:ATP-binding protein n=1 Tax=Desulfatiglans anilini TaxID=90728 RepID=UPI0004123918|nr:ATP-binding protein [Desulfatiglans anilini]
MILFSLFALVPLCAVGLFSMRTAEEVILKMAGNQVEQLARDKEALLERWISERKADIAVVAGSSILSSADLEAMGAYLRLVKENYRVYSGIAVVGGDGGLIYATPGGPPLPALGAWFEEARRGRLYMSDIRFDPEVPQSFFHIAAPLGNDPDKVERIVCATVGTGAILSAVLSISLGETGECYLVNREGMFLAHKEPQRILTENIAQSESFRNIFSERRKRITYVDYRGIEVIGASARVQGTDWALVVEQDRDEAFRSADVMGRYILLVTAFSTLAALLSAWLLSRTVATPIRKLSGAARSLAAGNYQRSDIRSERKDEIGLLYAAFAEMAEQLRDRQQNLEAQVVLREAELKETGVELKRTQEAAARSQQLAALGRLAAGVAHEIRTPLTSLKLYLESIEDDIEISPEVEEDYQVAMTQIRRMEATINRFLDFARPQTPILADIDPAELIEEALLVAGPRARQQETLIAAEIPDDLPRVRGDRKQLEEVFVNLMINALEAVTAGGELRIRAGTENGKDGPAGAGPGFVRIDVEDTGPGIDAENLPRLFDPFFTTKATGTGLGLSIAFTTLQRHGGMIKVQSREGIGTVFSVFIPIPDWQEGERWKRC